MRSAARGLAGALATAALFPGIAHAHVGIGSTSGLAHGFAHPLGGLDHVLAMVAVGTFAATLGGRALWLVPASFLLMMAAGGALGMAGVPVPFVETGIALSVVVLGLAVALRRMVPTAAAMALVGTFAVFHGHAHGAEMPVDATGAYYAVGFMLATALLHGAGLALGLAVAGWGRRSGAVLRVGGTGMALAGIAILGGWL